jgi:hypothetical protein
MKAKTFLKSLFTLLAAWPLAAVSADLVNAKDGSGTYGYKHTPKLPWCEWLVHDPDRPVPHRVDPGPPSASAPMPSDAISLFDGNSIAAWKSTPGWVLTNNLLVAGDGAFASKDSFGDIQLHLEWLGPADYEGPWYNRGNNGVFLMGLYEVQIFDSFHEKIYPDGMCGAIYGQTPPLVNVTRPPGQWQSFDIAFVAPRFEGEKLKSPARVTIFHNGVLVQLNEEIHGETGHQILPEYKAKVSEGPVVLGGHGCKIQFRNIWVRKL